MFNRKILSMFLSAALLVFIGLNTASFAQDKAAVSEPETAECNLVNTIKVNSLDVVANPSYYLDKDIIMDAVFDKFSLLGLNYNKALRSSTDYVGFLIQRDDADHDVPLSEMKLFIKREYAEKLIDLETGDKIQITGKVFSTALGDPWIDVSKIEVLKKAKAPDEAGNKTKKR